MKSNLTNYKQEERIYNSITNEFNYVFNMGKYFGLSQSSLQKSFSEIGSNKFEKKKLKQVFTQMSKNSYYDQFDKDSFDESLLHSTPLYKRLTKESFWVNSMLVEALSVINFGNNISLIDKTHFCCEALTMLLYSFTSMSLLFYNYRLFEFFNTLPYYTTVIFKEVSSTNDIFKAACKNSNSIYIEYQNSTTLAGILLSVIRNTWLYDYIVAISMNAIITNNCFPNGEIPKDDIINYNTDINTDLIQIIFSGLNQILSLMLHDKTSMTYFGNLPYYLLNTSSNIKYANISRIILENFGKMFWRTNSSITDTNSFIKEFSSEFTMSDDKITYIGEDIYNENKVILLPLEKWIYATNTISTFDPVFNPDEMLAKLHTNDLGEYISYVFTDLNIRSEDNKNVIFTIGKIIDNYKNATYVIDKSLSIDNFSNKFKISSSKELYESKQYQLYKDIISYKSKYDLGPNLLIRKINSLNDKLIKGVALNILDNLTYIRYTDNVINSAFIDNISRLASLIELDINEIKLYAIQLCEEIIKAYTALECNIYLNICNSYRESNGSLFANDSSITFYRIYIETMLSIKDNLNKDNIHFNQTIKELQNNLDGLNDKYKKCKSENNSLKNQLIEKTKEYNKTVSYSSKISELENQIKMLRQENESLKQEPTKLNTIIAKQKSHIDSIESKQFNQEQYEQRIKQLEEELARQERLWQSAEEENDVDVDLTEEEKYILSHLRLDMTVLDCESTKRLQKTIMTNSRFNFIPRNKSENNQISFSQNADIYLLATDVLGHKDSIKWQQALKSKSFRCVYSSTNGFQTLCRTILKKYYSMVNQNLIEPIEIPSN